MFVCPDRPFLGLSKRIETLSRIVDAVCLSTLHPRTAIRVVVQQVGQDDGSLFSVIVNACCLALMDAGVQLSSLFLGVTCAVTKGFDQKDCG